jgi:hypothetical protein
MKFGGTKYGEVGEVIILPLYDQMGLNSLMTPSLFGLVKFLEKSVDSNIFCLYVMVT